MSRYVGITIGPIFDTICETTKPAGLWFASSLFSDITRRLCAEIHSSENLLKGEILSPYYDEKESLADGVGKYHDRIIFKTNHYSKTDLDRIVCKVKRETIRNFPTKDSLKREKETKFLMDYLQIHYVVIEEGELPEKNAILALSPYLDAMELLKTFPANQENNPFERMLRDGREHRSNEFVTKSILFREINKNANQFYSGAGERKIREIQEIALGFGNEDSEFKKNSYFAVVSADGDGMGDFLSSLDKDEDITAFSKACLVYDKKAAEMIGAFRGMTIYAGGDDLLFLSPIEGEEGKSIFALCEEINRTFQAEVRAAFAGREKILTNIPTISFGVVVRYYKYPLYEALAGARTLLAYVKGKTEKNAIAVQVEKHSGQRMGVLIPHRSVSVVEALLQTGAGKFAVESEREAGTAAEIGVETVHNAIYTLENMSALICVLDGQMLTKKQYLSVWKNFFDNADQEKNREFFNQLCEIYYDYFAQGQSGIQALSDEKTENDRCFRAFTMLLRIKKFLKEKKGDRE